jgi:hypothetical protein
LSLRLQVNNSTDNTWSAQNTTATDCYVPTNSLRQNSTCVSSQPPGHCKGHAHN